MVLKKSLFAKISAFGFLLFSMAISILGVIGIIFSFGYLQIYEENYTQTSLCRNQLYQDSNDISRMYTLMESEKENGYLLDEDRQYLEYLEGYLFPPNGSNISWALVDTSGQCLLTNIANSENVLNEIISLTANQYEQIQISNRYIIIGLNHQPSISDNYTRQMHYFELSKRWIGQVIIATVFSFALSILLFSFLVAAAGHKKGVEGICLHPIDKIWLEIVTLAIICLTVFCVQVIFSGYGSIVESIAVIGFASPVFLIFFFSLIRRAKAGMLYKTSLFYLFMRFFRIIIRHLRLTARVILAIVIYGILQFILIVGMSGGNFIAGFFFLTTNVAVAICLCLGIIQYYQICKATERMAQGELGKVVDENTVPFFGRIARNLNSTGNAMDLAVKKTMQSERLKTELITNVSHDIKTPLTSIISYVGLLRTTNIQDPKALEYIDILDRKSRRLGQLMMDLVEASKVTSGNVSVSIEVLNLGELVKQAGGEFECRLEERSVQLVCSVPQNPVFVLADGRHLWRVLDNLFSNACKYALDGTRVYVDITEFSNEVLLSVKNISRDALNILPEELMERFVRGDESRNTEGSGLGLSIARSLMELQGGSMNIQIDGDLFKVILKLKRQPLDSEPSSPENSSSSEAKGKQQA